MAGPVSEKYIETYLIKRAKELPALCWKFTSPSMAGVPDRILIYQGLIVFIECKAPGKEPRLLQKSRINALRDHGARVYVIDSKEGVDELMEQLRKEKGADYE